MSYSAVQPLVPHPRRAALQTVVTRDRSNKYDRTVGGTFLIFWFVCGMFAGVALMKSSVGHSAPMQAIAKTIRAFAH